MNIKLPTVKKKGVVYKMLSESIGDNLTAWIILDIMKKRKRRKYVIEARDYILSELENFPFDPTHMFILGRRGYGKSALAEYYAARCYEEAERIIIDFYDNRNWEGQYWCVAKNPGEKAYPIFLVYNDSKVEMESTNEDLCKLIPASELNTTLRFYELLKDAQEERRIISICNATFKMDVNEHLKFLTKFLVKSFNAAQEPGVLGPVYLIREIGRVLYSGMKGFSTPWATELRRHMQNVIAWARHAKYTKFICDTQMYFDVARALREETDWLMFKRMPLRSLPREIGLGGPTVFAKLPYLSKNEVLAYNDVAYTFLHNPMPPFHHQEKFDRWEEDLPIEIKKYYLSEEEETEGEESQGRKSIRKSEEELIEIIRKGLAEGKSLRQIQRETGETFYRIWKLSKQIN